MPLDLPFNSDPDRQRVLNKDKQRSDTIDQYWQDLRRKYGYSTRLALPLSQQPGTDHYQQDAAEEEIKHSDRLPAAVLNALDSSSPSTLATIQEQQKALLSTPVREPTVFNQTAGKINSDIKLITERSDSKELIERKSENQLITMGKNGALNQLIDKLLVNQPVGNQVLENAQSAIKEGNVERLKQILGPVVVIQPQIFSAMLNTQYLTWLATLAEGQLIKLELLTLECFAVSQGFIKNPSSRVKLEGAQLSELRQKLHDAFIELPKKTNTQQLIGKLGIPGQFHQLFHDNLKRLVAQKLAYFKEGGGLYLAEWLWVMSEKLSQIETECSQLEKTQEKHNDDYNNKINLSSATPVNIELLAQLVASATQCYNVSKRNQSDDEPAWIVQKYLAIFECLLEYGQAKMGLMLLKAFKVDDADLLAEKLHKNLDFRLLALCFKHLPMVTGFEKIRRDMISYCEKSARQLENFMWNFFNNNRAFANSGLKMERKGDVSRILAMMLDADVKKNVAPDVQGLMQFFKDRNENYRTGFGGRSALWETIGRVQRKILVHAEYALVSIPPADYKLPALVVSPPEGTSASDGKSDGKDDKGGLELESLELLTKQVTKAGYSTF